MADDTPESKQAPKKRAAPKRTAKTAPAKRAPAKSKAETASKGEQRSSRWSNAGLGAAIGSAAIVAALLYVNRSTKKKPD
ncbi:hypothetical protein [Sphingomonas colocasiae]|uniref:Uncharacterized protein n=1 Tax=Sphingomonas colocasiae TaxID=1848973 RepID=A0ABS7Q1N6_9SPHN|nr:hypothetical protein [Sphingomonas colocasiae]MBY8826139.1 hypothetical protein [Sphingomonas colocasiae]